jgi:O-antigen ligase
MNILQHPESGKSIPSPTNTASQHSDSHRESQFEKYIFAVPALLFIMTPAIEMIIRMFFPVSESYVNGFEVFNAFKVNQWIVPICFLCSLAGYASFILHSTAESLREKRGQLLPYYLFGALILLMLISTICNGFTDAAISGEANRRESLFGYMLYFFTFFGCTAMICEKETKAFILHVFLIISMILAVLSLINISIYPFPGLKNYGPYSACFYNSNHYAYFLTIAVSVSLTLLMLEHNNWRILDLFAFLLNTVMLVFTHTSGCILACLASAVLLIFVLSLKYHRKDWVKLLLLIVLVFLISCVSPAFRQELMDFSHDLHVLFQGSSSPSFKHLGHNRMQQWMYTWKLIKEKPLLGWGVEGIREQLAAHSTAERPHNEYLQYAAFFGIPAVILYVSGILSIFIHALRRSAAHLDIYTLASLTGAFGYIVSACFGVSMFYTAPFFFIFLGLSM